ncbi:hypothetical protein D7M10_01890 [Pseudomonas fluorescens]|nr:hypothetical protein D7M10_01890 [Pseudomonas fluorescens]
MWERACSRMRSNSDQICPLTTRIREQARSHICFAVLSCPRQIDPIDKRLTCNRAFCVRL